MTGEQRYAERIASTCWAQPIASGDRIYFFGKNGLTTVIRAGPTFEKLATNALWDAENPPLPDPSLIAKPESADVSKGTPRFQGDEYLDPLVYGVAAADGAFFVRIGTRLYRIDARAGRR
jgi:hypothetical protein